MVARPILVPGAILLAAAIFGLDSALALGVAAGVPYVAVVLLARWDLDPRTVLYAAVACTGLTVLGYFLSPVPPEGVAKAVANRSLAVFAIWVTAIVVHSWKRTEAGSLEEAAYVKLLQGVAKAANLEPSAERALEKCLQLVCAHTGWPVGHAYVATQTLNGELEPTRIWFLEDAERFATFRRVTEATRFDRGIGLPGRVLATGRPAWIEDVTTDSNFPRAQMAVEIGVRAAFGFPVLVGSDVAAVLEFFATEPLQPNERLLEVMAQIGTQLGRTIERDRAEAGVRKSREKYRHIFEAAPVSIWEEDLSEVRKALDALRAEGVTDFRAYLEEHPEFVRQAAAMIQVVDVNEAGLRLTGIHDKQRLLGSLERIFDPNATEVLKAELVAIAEGKTRFEIESIDRNARGERLDTLVSLAIPEAHSDSLHLLACITDITARKRAESERAALEARIQHGQRLESLGVLAGGIAHDFNNLLAVILGNCRLALDEIPSDSPAHRMLGTTRRAAEHAAGLTEQMVIYAGKGATPREPVDLSDLVAEMLDLLNSTMGDDCTLETSLASNLTPIAGNPVQLRQVVLNLVTNAREALSGSERTVVLRTAEVSLGSDHFLDGFGNTELPGGEYIVLESSDTGDGIDRSIQARIFDPFFTTKLSGRGLGLAALLGIVRGHGGAIKIDSEPDAGATFRVFFPSSPGRDQRVAKTEKLTPGASRPARVLVVDDDQDMLDLTRLFLESFGFEVESALGGRRALELFQRRSDEIDAVVLDWAMPDLNGEQTFQEIRRLCATVPVIFVSGFSEENVVTRLARRELAGFLHKPFEPEQLAAAVNSALEMRRIPLRPGV